MGILSFLFGKEDDHYRIKKFHGKLCTKCSIGRTWYKSCLKWSEGSKNEVVEKFYKCDHCGHTVSNQWD